MLFEFDEIKNQSNYRKHGINFLDAQSLWNDPDRLQIPAKTTDEPLLLVIGKIADTHCSAVITHRSDKTRIISVRRAGKEEVSFYESERF
ncbi:BrnT family toxin [Nitrospira defluvii]|nr:BrnT family toxin [Nitrospira defluvii]